MSWIVAAALGRTQPVLRLNATIGGVPRA